MSLIVITNTPMAIESTTTSAHGAATAWLATPRMLNVVIANLKT
jgi:hypothetical protein